MDNNLIKDKIRSTLRTKCFSSLWSIDIKTCIKFLSMLFIEFSLKRLNSKRGFYFAGQGVPYRYNSIEK
jgi:hypothetical protein